MRPLIQLLFNVNRLVLFLLFVAFVSYIVVTFDAVTQYAEPVIQYATKYLPILLVPVILSMVVLLVLRYLVTSSGERINFGDIMAGVIALALQVGVIAVYRAGGGDVVNSSFLSNIPDVTALAEKAAPWSLYVLPVLQFFAFVFYWKADPNRR
ncbi:MAG: hypothetical protein AAF357_01265 [Verrucomicrobiota bacterium]